MQVALRTAAPGELAWINERYRSIDFRLSGADALESLLHKNTVVVVQFDHIGYRAQGNDIQ